MQPIHGLDDCDINLESQPVDKEKNKENMKETQPEDIGRCVYYFYSNLLLWTCVVHCQWQFYIVILGHQIPLTRLAFM